MLVWAQLGPHHLDIYSPDKRGSSTLLHFRFLHCPPLFCTMPHCHSCGQVDVKRLGLHFCSHRALFCATRRAEVLVRAEADDVAGDKSTV